MAMTMYNPAHPGEILREYLGGVQVGCGGQEAARGPANAVAPAQRMCVVYSGDGAPAGRCLRDGAGHVARLAAAIRFMLRRQAQASKVKKFFKAAWLLPGIRTDTRGARHFKNQQR